MGTLGRSTSCFRNHELRHKCFRKDLEFFAQYDIYGKISANVEGLDAVTLHVYPNPAQSVIQLEGIDMQLGTTVEIQNSYGKTVAFFNQPQAELDVSKLPSGVYFLRVLNDNTIHSVKFMKQ